MDNYQIVLTSTAENDIIEIARYITIELLNRDAANQLVDKFYSVMNELKIMPQRHEKIQDDEYIIPPGIRRISVNNYDIYYSCDEMDQIVYIRRVVYSKREWQKLV